ncbi:MAG: DUF4253 domain-containing protein [Sphingomonas sp.]|nr:MAG: DUF4253 domain-containing protein [Sphingomonas sp.]
MGLFDSIRRWIAGTDTHLSVQTPSPFAVDGPAPLPNAVPETPSFPYPLVTVHGREALATWSRLRKDPDTWPVVLGNDHDVAIIREGIEEIDKRRPDAILAIASTLSFPASLAAHRDDDVRDMREWMRDRGCAEEEEEHYEPPLGDWPVDVAPVGFIVASDSLTGQYHERVHIAVLPCSTGWEAMAYLRWGSWNDNPAAEYHVAALKNWNERFGAELVGCSHDVVNLHVATRPATREAALELAREQYLYCSDLIDQGTETLAALAGALMADDWWYFWWD